MSDKDWALLCLHLTKQTNEEQSKIVLQWIQSSTENRAIFEDAQLIMRTKQVLPKFDSFIALKKIKKKI